MSRPSDHYDSAAPAPKSSGVTQPKLGIVGTLRFFWRQLTSMRTALFLLLLLAVAAVPGSLFSQRSSDPNGVTQYFQQNPDLAPILDKFQLFDVYTSVWFSAIYLLLFVSLIGCVVPRTLHHARALRSRPPKTPAHLERLGSFAAFEIAPGQTDAAGAPITPATAVAAARALLRRSGYRTQLFDGAGRSGSGLSVSAERGYLRETGNLVFHMALIGILIAVGVGGGFGYTGQKVLVPGQVFANVRLAFDSFTPGRFFTDSALAPYRIRLDSFTAKYETENLNAFGQPIDYTAKVTTYQGGQKKGTKETIKVNDPLAIGGNQVYLLGNGYAPKITLRDPDGAVVFSGATPFLPQDANLTSLGVLKIPDGLKKQLGMRGLFYPTAAQDTAGITSSTNPDLLNPELALVLYTGDLGIDAGEPKSVYSLDTTKLTEIAGPDVDTKSIHLAPGQTVDIPGGLGTITFDNVSPKGATSELKSVPRFASLDIHRDPTQGWVLFFAILVLLGLLTGLFVPRRRVWVKALEGDDGSIRLEYAGLARGEDPGLDGAVADIAAKHSQQLGLRLTS
ncbi:cytochrome c biogenesis protein ResB [Lacisediminihabitans changchengi]|uniref:Cytochrome c biogenesis protein ResB n=1 Tax=Lacisediminihabitans changchengi TaxID=2787634 RepID=A0A934SU78_9MICO|nr:cytochrome c biogenesis protein ResB [Lacisediminihabitans changchengi]MBK4349010.1 cytochrome c biogenesis protein ResB [Lacisediminihabitans changchengi]